MGGNVQDTQDYDLTIYTLFTFINCCCMGNILGFILCMWCRSGIKNNTMAGNNEAANKWRKRFWLCFFFPMILELILTIVAYITAGSFLWWQALTN